MTLPQNKTLRYKISHLTQSSGAELTPRDVAAARDYIGHYWAKLVRYNQEDHDSLVGLPYPYLVPAFETGHEFDFNELYYWDSYFMIQPLLLPQNKQFILGIVEDLFMLLDRFGIIPNASRTYTTGRSQPPFLTSMILDVHRVYDLDDKWLRRAIDYAHKEYAEVWNGTKKPHARRVYRGLSRYYDFNYLHDIAEAESGWDMTPRFHRHALDYLPVDLNSLLYKYEKDFAYVERLLGNRSQAEGWDRVAYERRMTVNELMWSERKGLYYDYNYKKQSRSGVASLAAYYPLWTGLASQKQASRLVSSLRKFEKRGGLSTTDAPQVEKLMPGSLPTQWAYPNGWAPLHFIVIRGLQNYGYHDDARRIALKWLRTNLNWFNQNGVFLEKYNVVSPGKPPAKGVYPSQTGFGWTNAVFEVFCREFVDRR